MSILDDVMGEYGFAVPKAAYDKLQEHIAARQPVDEVSVKKEDANNYCLILRALGMEEEGDPVAEVKALIEARDRQPVGQEPVAYGVSNRDGLWMCDFGLATINKESAESFAAWAEEHRTISGPFTVVSFYAAPPAQGINLGRFREAVRYASGVCPHEDIAAKLSELLALIDSQAAVK